MPDVATEKTKMPEVLTFNGGTYRVNEHPELKEFVGEVVKHIATTEKTKLYGQIKTLQTKFDALEYEAKNGGEPIDYTKISEIIGVQLKEQLAANETSITAKVKEFISPVVNNIQSQEVANLQAYTLNLLKSNEGLCMPELVVGETKADIDAAMDRSKKLFATYAGQPPVLPINSSPTATPINNVGNPNAQFATSTIQNNQSNQPVMQAPVQTVTPPVNTAPSATQIIEETTAPNIKSISQTEWKNKRAAVEAELRSIMGQ